MGRKPETIATKTELPEARRQGKERRDFLMSAAQEGNIGNLRLFKNNKSQGMNLSVENNAALITAAKAGHREFVESLLSTTDVVDFIAKQNLKRNTPLIQYLVSTKDVWLLGRLLEKPIIRQNSAFFLEIYKQADEAGNTQVCNSIIENVYLRKNKHFQENIQQYLINKKAREVILRDEKLGRIQQELESTQKQEGISRGQIEEEYLKLTEAIKKEHFQERSETPDQQKLEDDEIKKQLAEMKERDRKMQETLETIDRLAAESKHKPDLQDIKRKTTVKLDQIQDQEGIARRKIEEEYQNKAADMKREYIQLTEAHKKVHSQVPERRSESPDPEPTYTPPAKDKRNENNKNDNNKDRKNNEKTAGGMIAIYKEWVSKKLNIPKNEDIRLKDLLQSYVKDNQIFANRHHRKFIKELLTDNEASYIDDITLFRKLQIELKEKKIEINPQGTLALIIRYMEAKQDYMMADSDQPVASAKSMNSSSFHKQAYEQLMKKLKIEEDGDEDPAVKVRSILQAYCKKPLFSTRHNENIKLVNQVVDSLMYDENATAQDYYNELVKQIHLRLENQPDLNLKKLDINPQGTLAMVLDVVKELAKQEVKPELSEESEQSLRHTPRM